MKLDPQYTDPALVALYDAECGWSADRQFYADLAGDTPCRVLDIGCGTGLLAVAIAAAGHEVTGVDPAPAMLEVARHRPGGCAVRWVQGTASAVSGTFDLIIMTGHAFQTLLEFSEIMTLFDAVRDRLAPGGRFVFETRNPAINWARRWTGDVTVDGITITRTVTQQRHDEVQFITRYHLPGETRQSTSTLRFAARGDIRALAGSSGLRCRTIWGDWAGGAFDPNTSDEMIFELVRATGHARG